MSGWPSYPWEDSTPEDAYHDGLIAGRAETMTPEKARSILCADAQAKLDGMEVVPTGRCPYCGVRGTWLGGTYWYWMEDEDSVISFCPDCGSKLPTLKDGKWVIE